MGSARIKRLGRFLTVRQKIAIDLVADLRLIAMSGNVRSGEVE